MKIDRGKLIAGQKLKVVREILRDLRHCDSFGTGAVLEHLQKQCCLDYIDELVEQGQLPKDLRSYFRRDWEGSLKQETIYGGIRVRKMPNQLPKANALIDQLLKDGIIERKEDYKDKPHYAPTMKGNALSMTRFVPRLNRAKADKLLADFLKRVKDVNANETFLNWITEVRVFGSYLTDTDDLGDLDLAIKLARRPNWTTDNCIAMADAIDQQMLFHEKLNYPEKLLRQKIRNRSPYISLHYTDELDRNPELGGKTIYKFPPPKPKTKAKKMTGKQRAAKKVK
jgi:predicted nucleotidyltransferase